MTLRLCGAVDKPRERRCSGPLWKRREESQRDGDRVIVLQWPRCRPGRRPSRGAHRQTRTAIRRRRAGCFSSCSTTRIIARCWPGRPPSACPFRVPTCPPYSSTSLVSGLECMPTTQIGDWAIRKGECPKVRDCGNSERCPGQGHRSSISTGKPRRLCCGLNRRVSPICADIDCRLDQLGRLAEPHAVEPRGDLAGFMLSGIKVFLGVDRLEHRTRPWPPRRRPSRPGSTRRARCPRGHRSRSAG